MRPDIVNLRQFYSTPLGRKTRQRLRRMTRGFWPSSAHAHMVGVGYTVDILPLPQKPAHVDHRILALMPLAQGAIYWPVQSMNHSALADEMRPPFAPATLDRVVMLHAVEHAVSPEELLRVWWQLLVPGGRMMLMLPNRHGLWARFGATPFSTGVPYTLQTIRELLNDAGFTLRDVRSALFAPPSNHPFWLALFTPLEWLGLALFPRMGGALLVEAEKQIYAGVKEPSQRMKLARAKRPVAVASIKTQ